MEWYLENLRAPIVVIDTGYGPCPSGKSLFKVGTVDEIVSGLLTGSLGPLSHSWEREQSHTITHYWACLCKCPPGGNSKHVDSKKKLSSWTGTGGLIVELFQHKVIDAESFCGTDVDSYVGP